MKTVAFSGKSSDLDNDAKFQTENDLNTALAAKQDNLISSGAAVGDLIKVKSVDSSGVPTAWEVAVEGVDYIKSAPVTSVNNKTGAVSLSAADVGAATTSNINTALNRTNAVNVANSDYTTYMARGEALFSAETTPSVNGTIAWQYE